MNRLYKWFNEIKNYLLQTGFIYYKRVKVNQKKKKKKNCMG